MKQIRLMFFALVCVLVVFGNRPTTAKAEDNAQNSEYIVIYSINDERYPSSNELAPSVTKADITRGNNEPGVYYDLFESDYFYSFSNMYNFTYTSCYFKPTSTGNLTLSLNSWTSGGEDVRIELYLDHFLLTDTLVSSCTWVGNPTTILGIGYSNLDPDSNYYFKFLAYDADVVSGSGYVYHE